MTALLPVYPRMPLELVRASGTRLFTADGRELLDLYGGHAVCPLGHGHPELTEALTQAHSTLDFYSNSLHMPVQESAARAVLGEATHLAHTHFVNSGTEANEAAIHLARRKTGRTTIVTLDCGFHGRTLGSLSVTGLAGYRERVAVDLPDDVLRTIRFNAPDDLSRIDDTVAGVLIELVPSIAGILEPDPAWLTALEARCRAVGALLILDEVQAGVGRMGSWFGHERFGLQPDMVTLAKSLGGGFPVGALVTSAEIGEWVGFGEIGTTFGGGPLAAVMVETVARIIRRDGLMERVLAIETRVRELMARIPGVTVRGYGCLVGVETALPSGELRDALLARDIVVGVSGHLHTVRLLMSYVTTDEELERFATAMNEVIGG